MEETNYTSLFGRRDFIRIGSLGALGLNLAGSLRAGTGKDASCILVWQSGGCGHQDTFDMKPDAPLEYRGEFKPIPTNVAGIQICEHLPRTAAQADKFTILRSMRSQETNHERAINSLPAADEPSAPGCPGRSLTLPADADWSRLGNRRWLLERMDAKFRAIEASGDFPAMDACCQRAYDLLTSPKAKKAFDVEAESRALRERYGHTPVGQSCLLARRLVESGVRFVTVVKGRLNYDTHTDNFNTMKKALLPEFDRAFAALLEDLHQRGMLDTTLVIAMGEFGRTPKVNRDAGRDHHAKAWSIVMAGAGIPGGRVLGATDKTASEVTDLPVGPEDLVFTIRTLLGSGSARERHTASGYFGMNLNCGRMIPGLLA